ncbi:antibiotic biosynthesis monooxygenase family protein [Agromyces binzhouensis]|uniref:Antibiotic biosynthesis monooxygenase n=1 Tax=Agromyces binzhouensis TaxID=1817495 RepID=A0A4Q2JTE3_9MICO|nr:antibiotic biosynthesis monooxygenase [Agromyces binzhouensis]RXZ49797.1 antibiotic biosynthesis monooxygenase [Agromyces binzhouensis]
MILEHAILPVVPGREAEFEAAFAEALTIISGMPGFVDLTLSRSIETPNAYLLLVHWERVEDHDPGFREAPEYGRWRELLHGHYEPFPVVEHFRQVASIGMSSEPAGADAREPADADGIHPTSAAATR